MCISSHDAHRYFCFIFASTSKPFKVKKHNEVEYYGKFLNLENNSRVTEAATG